MTVAIGLGLITAIAVAAYPSVRRRHVRAFTVRRVRASLAPWLTPDMAAPLRPVFPEHGFDSAGVGRPPDLLTPAVRRHVELSAYEIEHHRRTA